MKLIGKILSLPLILVTGILYDFCKFVVIASGAVLGILSGIVFLAALGSWTATWACVAGNGISYQSLRSSDGGGLAGWKAGRSQ